MVQQPVGKLIRLDRHLEVGSLVAPLEAAEAFDWDEGVPGVGRDGPRERRQCDATCVDDGSDVSDSGRDGPITSAAWVCGARGADQHAAVASRACCE